MVKYYCFQFYNKYLYSKLFFYHLATGLYRLLAHSEYLILPSYIPILDLNMEHSDGVKVQLVSKIVEFLTKPGLERTSKLVPPPQIRIVLL